MNSLSFVLRRAARHWQMLLTLGLGVLIATALLAAGPVLVNTVVEFGLRRTMLSGDPLTGNLQLRAFDRTDAADYAATDAQVQATVNETLGPYLDRIVPTAAARWLFPWLDEAALPDERLTMRVYGSDEDILSRATLVAGAWPAADQTGADGVFQAAIGEEMAEAYGLAPGDKLPLSPTRDAGTPTHTLLVSGIIRPTDARDPFWFGEFSPLRVQSDERFRAQYSVLVPAAAFFPLAEALFPDAPYELTWNVLLDPARIGTADIPDIQSRLPVVSAELRALSPAVTTDTNLNDVLANFASQANSVRAPLYFLTAEVVLLALYYVIMVSALSVRQVEREFAVLQSRGASGRQIFGLQATEAFLVAGVAFISGPLLATALVQALTTFGPLADVSEPGWPLSLPQLAWVAAAVGAAACLVALLLPVGPAIRRSIVSYQQESARSSQPPFWQRAYLDVILLLVGLVLLWRLQLYGGLVGAGSQVDWLLLLSPVALLIGAGTILLRVFPLVLNGLANLAARGRGLPGSLALWQAARNPTHVARLVLLLTLAIALGILTTGINATLDASEIERSQYAAGSDVRLVANRALSLSDVSAVPGVDAGSSIYRTDGSMTIGRSYLRFETLGIAPESFGDLTTTRDDFAAQPLDELLPLLAGDTPLTTSTIELPGRPADLGLWVWAGPDVEERRSFNTPQGAGDLERVALQARLVSALGETFAVGLDPDVALDSAYPDDGWLYVHAALPALSESSYPLLLDSLTVRNRARATSGFARQLPETMNLALDEVTVLDRDTGQSNVMVDVEQRLADLPDVEGLVGGFTADEVRSGAGSLAILVDFPPGGALPLREIPPAPMTEAGVLPALASERFLAATGTAVGETVNLTINSLPTAVELVGAVTYFPTLYDDLNAGFLITNRDALLAQLNANANSAVNSNEAILAAAEGVAPEEVGAAAAAGVSGLSQVLEADAIRRTIKADPMGLGLRSVTLFGYVLTAMLSLVGFATYFYFSARQRESMYGVLRSIGMSPRQLYTSLLLEQVLLIVAGVTIGTLLGLLLNRITLPGLPITFGDRPPTPPFIAQNDWAAVGRIYLTLAVAFFFALGAATLLLYRTNLHRALRVGEE